MSERELFEIEMEKLSGKVKGVYYSDNEGGYVVEDILKDNESAKILATIYNVSFEMWKASANRQGYKLVPVEMSWQKADDLAMDEWNKNKELFKSQNRDLTAIQVQDFRLKWCRNKAHQIMSEYKAMIGAVE